MKVLPTCADVQPVLHAVVAADARDRLEDAPDAPSRRDLEHADQLRTVGQARRHADGGDVRHVCLGARSVGLRGQSPMVGAHVPGLHRPCYACVDIEATL